MKTAKFFKGITDLTELKKVYYKLALQFHPDRGGDTATMQQINNEYEVFSQALINGNADFSEGRKAWETKCAGMYTKIIEKIINLPGLIIEICGTWIWVTGNTFANKEQLAEHGFRFSRPKMAWYHRPEGFRKTSKGKYSLNKIREIYGSELVERMEEQEETQRLSA
jgi:hypothetical protein